MTDSKTLYSFRLSTEADALLNALSDKFGVSRTAILELSIRDYAKKHEVEYIGSIVTDTE